VQKTTAMVAIILGGLLGGWMLLRLSLRKRLRRRRLRAACGPAGA